MAILCPRCRGKGIIVIPENAPAFTNGVIKTCPRCNGTGAIEKKTREK